MADIHSVKVKAMLNHKALLYVFTLQDMTVALTQQT